MVWSKADDECYLGIYGRSITKTKTLVDEICGRFGFPLIGNLTV
jgi:hypothetical protein